MPYENADRKPNWKVWKPIPSAKLYEAVALSLNIEPKLLHPNLHNWMGGRQFNEGAEFQDRLFLANRCLGETLPGPLNALAVRYYDEDPLVRLQDFVNWSLSVGWELPPELQELANIDGTDKAGTRRASETVTPKSEDTQITDEPGWTLEDALRLCGDEETRREYKALSARGITGLPDPAPIGPYFIRAAERPAQYPGKVS